MVYRPLQFEGSENERRMLDEGARTERPRQII
jgi:hypothetical protein